MEYTTEVINITKITEGFFIGDSIAGTNEEVITQFKITHIINAAGTQILNQFEEVGIKYLTINWQEIPSQNLFDTKDELAERIVSFIDEGINVGEGLLVHSVRGKNRICLVTMIYFMKKYNWSLQKTLEFLFSKKPDVEIPKFFFIQMQNFEGRLIAKNKIVCSNNWEEECISNNDEKLIRNTYINSLAMNKLIQQSKNSTELIKSKKGKLKVGWSDKNNMGKGGGYLINSNPAKDLFLIQDIRVVTSHIRLRPSRSAIKTRSLSTPNSNINKNPQFISNPQNSKDTNDIISNNNNNMLNNFLNKNLRKDNIKVNNEIGNINPNIKTMKFDFGIDVNKILGKDNFKKSTDNNNLNVIKKETNDVQPINNINSSVSFKSTFDFSSPSSNPNFDKIKQNILSTSNPNVTTNLTNNSVNFSSSNQGWMQNQNNKSMTQKQIKQYITNPNSNSNQQTNQQQQTQNSNQIPMPMKNKQINSQETQIKNPNQMNIPVSTVNTKISKSTNPINIPVSSVNTQINSQINNQINIVKNSFNQDPPIQAYHFRSNSFNKSKEDTTNTDKLFGYLNLQNSTQNDVRDFRHYSVNKEQHKNYDQLTNKIMMNSTNYQKNPNNQINSSKISSNSYINKYGIPNNNKDSHIHRHSHKYSKHRSYQEENLKNINFQLEGGMKLDIKE